MGLLDAIFGRKRLPRSKTDKLSSITGADLTIRTRLGAEPTGTVALAVRAVAIADFERVCRDVAKMLEYASESFGSVTSMVPDDYGFLWVVVRGEDFADLAATAQIAAETISEEGYRDHLLCAVFHFLDSERQPLDIVYSFKRAKFYAFAPRPGKQRDSGLEIRAHAMLDGELPLENDMEYRYPLWGVPSGQS